MSYKLFGGKPNRTHCFWWAYLKKKKKKFFVKNAAICHQKLTPLR